MLDRLKGRPSVPGAVAVLAVGVAMAGLVAGYEPIGADPDLLYRPIKSELARSLRVGRLPLWSDHFGLGVPLAAESHVAAFYPPNWVAYRFLGVEAAYRLMMGLHVLATAAATFLYARGLGLGPWGGSLAAVSFSLCGFQAIHAGHEPLYLVMPYLPLCLLAGDRYAEGGRPAWLALLTLAWGAQITVGHFQVQMWTAGLVLLNGTWRIVADRGPRSRIIGLVLAIGWGLAVAAVQLALTFELTRVAGFSRSFDQLASYAFPPGHWAHPGLPALFAGLIGPSANDYWGSMATSAGEATFYVGTVPLVLAFVGFVAGRRPSGLSPWRLIVPASLVLASLPLWFPLGYWGLTCLPGLSWFRCPARYTALASLGLALLAGRGLDRSLPPLRFRAGMVLATLFGLSCLAWGGHLVAEPAFSTRLAGSTLPYRFGVAVASWTAAVGAVIAWRRGRLGAWSLVALTALELGVLYHLGPVRWGWAAPFPEESPILRRLAEEPGVGLIAGQLDDLPVRAALTPAYPYLGIAPPPPIYLLEAAKSHTASIERGAVRWLRRFGVTHGVWHEHDPIPGSETVFVAEDPALDRLLLPTSDKARPSRWKIVRHPDTWPAAWASPRAVVVANWEELYMQFTRSRSLETAWFLAEDAPLETLQPRAESAQVRSWDGQTAVVEHDGTCDLIVRRTFYPGWSSSINGGPERPVLKANGGLQAVRIEGPGPSRVTFAYRPTRLVPAAIISLIATAAGLLVLVFARRCPPKE